MVEETTKFMKIDLNQFKLQLYLRPEVEVTLHFDSPSRKFYLSVIGLVVHEMKKRGKVTDIPLRKHLDILTLLNKTVGASAGSSKTEHLLPRIYRKWKDALPDLENAPLFKVIGRKKRYDDSMDKVYRFGESEKDNWANLFEYKGSYENLRLRFSIDRLDASVDNVILVYGEYPELANEDAWDSFITHLKRNLEAKSINEPADGELKASEPQLFRQRRRLRVAPYKWHRPALWALIGIFIGAAAFALWEFNFFAPQVEVASVEQMASPLPAEPSIAVLPFRNLSEDPEQEYFSDGLTEEIITELHVKLTEGEQARIFAKGTDNLEAYLTILKARGYLMNFKPENNAIVRQLAEKAIELDPDWPIAFWTLGATYVMDVFYGLTKTPDISIEAAYLLSQKSIVLNENLGLTHHGLSIIYTLKKNHEKAIEHGRLAVELDPNCADFKANLARILMNGGRPQESIPLYKKALRLNPYTSSSNYSNYGFALWMEGQYEEAVNAGKEARRRGPNDIFSHILLAITYIELGRDEDARTSVAELLSIKTDVTLGWLSKMLPWKDMDDADRFIGNLRKAGIPD